MNPARPAAPILIVDDNDEVRAAIAALLESHGYHVLFARDGREALRVLCGADVTPCLILLDLMMPLLDGWDFHAEQKRNPRLSAIPVLVVSAHPLAALATNAGAAADPPPSDWSGVNDRDAGLGKEERDGEEAARRRADHRQVA
jgi:CheY-like chemotaxis protein